MNRLYRSPDDRVLAGVAGGMAEAYDLDPSLVRLGWALLIVFTGGAFLIIYVVMALVVPLRPFGNQPSNSGGNAAMSGVPMAAATAADQATDPSTDTHPLANPPQPAGTPPPTGGPQPAWTAPYSRPRREGGGALVIGVVLVIVGGFLLARQFFPLFDIGRFWPVLVIAIGLVLIVTAFGRRRTP